MSIIQTIRDRGTWLIFTLLVLALIAFIFMDAGRRDNIFGGGGRSSIGSVNGKKINSEVYNARVDALRQIYSNNPQITEDQIATFVWNSMVDEKLMNSEVGKLAGNFSDKELFEIAIGKYGQPNQHMFQLFSLLPPQVQMVDPNTRQIDQKKAEDYYRYIMSSAADPKDQVLFKAILGMVRHEYVLNKHQMYMSTVNYAPVWLAKKQLAENNSMAKISYVFVPYTDLSDSLPELKITDADLEKYMAKSPDLYRQEENRVIDYTVFSFAPTAKDSLAIYNELVSLKEQMKTTPDSLAGKFATTNSSRKPFTDQFIRKAELAIGDSSLPFVKGNTFGPYLDGGNYTIAKIVDVKDYADTATSRHVLIKISDPQSGQVFRTEAEAKKLIDSVKMLNDAGISIDSLAKKFSEDEGSKPMGGLIENSAFGGTVPEYNDFIMGGNPGEKKIVKTVYGYHFIELISKKKISPAYKVAYLARAIEPSQTTRDSVNGAATAFAAGNRTDKAFDEYFTKNSTGKQAKVPGVIVSRTSSAIQGFSQKATEMQKWAFTAKKGQVSEPIIMNDEMRIGVAKLADIKNEGQLSAKDARPMIETVVRNERKYEILAKKYPGGGSLQDIAAKTGKQVVTQDSISFASASIPNLGNEPRVAGAMFNQTYQTKASGPIRGVQGVYFIKIEGQPYAAPGASSDYKMVQEGMKRDAQNSMGGSYRAFRKGAKIKDKRLEAGF
jgi:peptidyl-prolyl cis-trans isomerase D